MPFYNVVIGHSNTAMYLLPENHPYLSVWDATWVVVPHNLDRLFKLLKELLVVISRSSVDIREVPSWLKIQNTSLRSSRCYRCSPGCIFHVHLHSLCQLRRNIRQLLQFIVRS